MTQTLQERLDEQLEEFGERYAPEHEYGPSVRDSNVELRKEYSEDILSIIQEEKIKELQDLLTFPTLKSRQVISPKMQSIYKDEHVRKKDIEARITELQKGITQ